MLVQKLRLQRGWSQEQLAQLSGLSVRTIQRIERGQAASTESLKSLGAVFEVDFSTLKGVDMTANTLQKESDMSEIMNKPLSTEESLALSQVRQIKGFYIHAVQYFFVISILTAINYLTAPHRFWVIWVALGWGSGLLVHGLRVFDKVPFLNGVWERRQVEKRLGRKL